MSVVGLHTECDTHRLTIVVDYLLVRREARHDVAGRRGPSGPARLRAHRGDGPRDDRQSGLASGLARAEHHQAVPRAWSCPADLRTGDETAGRRGPAAPRARARLLRHVAAGSL